MTKRQQTACRKYGRRFAEGEAAIWADQNEPNRTMGEWRRGTIDLPAFGRLTSAGTQQAIIDACEDAAAERWAEIALEEL